MNYDNKVPEWKNAGNEPPESLKNDGFKAGYKPPASYFNWFWSGVSKCLKELQEKLGGADDKAISAQITADAATTSLAIETKIRADVDTALGNKIDHISSFDKVIRTQAEFETLIASPTWLDAVSICFVGDGGVLKFTKSDGVGCRIPQTVKQIQGVNSATIEVPEFVYSSTNKAALWYETLPTTDDYWINGMTVKCNGNGGAFQNCTQLVNCAANSSSIGIQNCTQLVNCTVTSSGSIGFQKCTQLTNCIGISNGDNAAFYNCAQLINCVGTSKDVGFYGCTQLTNCTGTGTSSSHSYGFRLCTQLANCVGTGIGTSYGYGFDSCKYLSGCKQGTTASTTAIFNNCTFVDSETNEGVNTGGTSLVEQINSMLPLDGSKKMTGALETVGSNTETMQIIAGDAGVSYEQSTKSLRLCTNCYYDTGWKYKSDGEAALLGYNHGYKSVVLYEAESGLKDAPITWEIASPILTNQTGVKKSGDTMSGQLTIANSFPQLSLQNDLNTTNIVNTAYYTHIQDWKSANKDDYVELLINASSIKNSTKLVFHIPNVINSCIYGEHNPQIVRADYIGDGQTNRVITLPFTPRGILVIDGAYLRMVHLTDYGIIVASDANTIGRGYIVYAFK